ncbi:MAG: RraA family protein [Acidimicrobiia bacterium]|nr:RraA family protein [Acidimicrobiia bacterium]
MPSTNREANDVPTLSSDQLDALASIDTPTVCNALEVLVPERRGWGYTVHPLVCAFPDLGPIVGFARTATIRASRPSGRGAAEDTERRLAYYRHVNEQPHPTITVIEDLDDPPGYGAWWGEVNTHVHRGLGSRGVITNGSIRDLDVSASEFQLLAGRVGPSHAFVHVEDVAVTVTVAGLVVRPGDLIHADRHGAVVIPLDVAEQVVSAAERLAAAEQVLIEASKQPGFDAATVARIITGGAGDH